MERFSNFGAPLLEGFANINANDEDCFTNNQGAKYCRVLDVDEDEGNDLYEQEMIDSEATDPVPTTRLVGDNDKNDNENDTEENDTEENDNDNDNENDNDDENDTANNDENDTDDDELEEAAEEEPEPTDKIEEFSNKNVVEGFAGNSVTLRQLMNLNLLLKSILFGCLFYILAHPQTRSFMTKNLFKKLKKSQYLYVAMVMFVVIYYVLNLVV